MRVLLVEDDQRLVRMLRYALEDEGFSVESASDGPCAEWLTSVRPYDVIVLDVMLPGKDGIEVCRDLRRAAVRTPVLMLTARDAIEDRVRGLDAGADDYLVKPFARTELIARLRAITRRQPPSTEQARLQAGPLVMDLERHEVTREGRPIELSPREFSLLQYFMRHPGQVLSGAQIREVVWGQEGTFTSNVVEIYVHYVRDKIDRPFSRRLLHTVRGAGYVLKP